MHSVRWVRREKSPDRHREDGVGKTCVRRAWVETRKQRAGAEEQGRPSGGEREPGWGTGAGRARAAESLARGAPCATMASQRRVNAAGPDSNTFGKRWRM